MGQLSAELNYERRLKRYEEEIDERILNSEDWEEELERYLEEAMKEVEEREEESKGGLSEEYVDSSLMMMEANLSEEEKREGEGRMEERHGAITSEGLVLLQELGKEEEKSETEGLFPALEMGDYLRDLEVEVIEVPVEQHPETVERLEELSEEERRQEELYRDELFKATAAKIEAEEGSEGPLERLEWLLEKAAESQEIEEKIEGLPEELRQEELVEEPDGMEERVEELIEGVRELIEGEEFLEEVVEGLEEAEEEAGEEGVLEEEVKPPEELVGEGVEEELGEVEEVVEEAEEERALEEEAAEELAEEVKGEEEVEELVEEVSEEAVEEVEGEEEEAEELVEEGEGPPKRPPEAVAAGEEEPKKEFEDILVGKTIWFRGKELKRGLYLIRAVRDDKNVFEWVTGIKKESKSIYIRKDLVGRYIKKLEINKYDKARHFPRRFELFGYQLYFDPLTNKLMIDNKEIGVETVKWNLDPDKISSKHGPSVIITTQLKSIEGKSIMGHGGYKLQVRLSQDGAVALVQKGGHQVEIKHLEVKGDLLVIKCRIGKDRVTVYPLYPKELKMGIRYETCIEVREREEEEKRAKTAHIIHALREIHGYDNVEKLKKDIEAGKAYLRLEFDNGMQTYCANKNLAIRVSEGAEKIMSYTVVETRDTDRALLELMDRLRENAPHGAIIREVGKAGEHLIRDEKMEEIRKFVSEKLGIPRSELKFEGPESEGPDWSVKSRGETVAIIEAKGTIIPERFAVQMKSAEKKLVDEYLSGKFGHGKYSRIEHGFAVACYFEPKEALVTDKGRIKEFNIEYVPNPFITKKERDE